METVDFEAENYVYVPRKKQKKLKKKKSFLRRFIFKAAVFLAFIFFLALIAFNTVTPIIVATAEAKIKSLSTMAINSAIFEVMSMGVKYNDLITITKDDAGKIQLIQANAVLINRLAQDTARTSELQLSKIGEQGINIPIGTLSGLTIFTGQGPSIVVKVVPAGSVVCEFMSEFENAGINQTRHKIYLEVVTAVLVVLPANNLTIYTNTQVLVAESIIVGEVPNTYLSMDSIGGSRYNLVPQ
jgi:sporulation protein YunB